MYLAYTPEREALREELRAYFATMMTPEVETEVANGDTGRRGNAGSSCRASSTAPSSSPSRSSPASGSGSWRAAERRRAQPPAGAGSVVWMTSWISSTLGPANISAGGRLPCAIRNDSLFVQSQNACSDSQ